MQSNDNERTKALAYDPVRDRDVEIECNHMHVSTRYDDIDGTDFPVIIESDFKHDPVEACQGTYTAIIEIPEGCPNCGYDRANQSDHTLAGVHRQTCRACGVDITDRDRDDWSPSEPTDHIERIKRDLDYVGKTKPNGTPVYARRVETGTTFYSILGDHGVVSIDGDEAVDLLTMLLNDMEEGDLATRAAHRLVVKIADAIPSSDDEEGDDD